MKVLSKSELWNNSLVFPKVFESISKQSSFFFEDKTGESRSGWSLPVMLFYEIREDDNYLMTHFYIGGGASGSSSFGYEGGRHILDLDNAKRFNEAVRGKLLSAFCKIDFILDILVCIDFGAYEGNINEKHMKKIINERGGLVKGTGRKLDYIQSKRILDNNTIDTIRFCKKIRDILAHQYLPDLNSLLSQITNKELERNWVDAIEDVFNSAWYLMMVHYSKSQLVVYEYFKRIQ